MLVHLLTTILLSAARPDSSTALDIRIRAVGDVMLGTTLPEGNLPPNDGKDILSGVKALLIDADLTFANLEGPLCDNGVSDKCKRGDNCYAFRSPTRYGAYLKEAGVDFVSTANNHSGDFGEPCRRETEKTLDSLGIAWSGPAGSVARLEKNGLRIAMVAFHTSPSCNHLNDLSAAETLVRKAAEESDVTIVSFHGGAEGAKALHVPDGKEIFFGEDRGNLREFAHRVVDAGADLVLGHGPHVLRGVEVWKGRLIAYSLGNFATYKRFNLNGPLGISVVLDATLDRDGRFVRGKLLPTHQLGEGVPMPDPQNRATDQIRELSRADFPNSSALVQPDGTLSFP